MARKCAWAAIGLMTALFGSDASAFVSPGISSSARCPPGMLFTYGGSFVLFSTKVPVTVAPHCMDVLEVTNDAYAECVTAGKCNAVGMPCSTRATYGKAGKGNLPVTCEDWKQAMAFCAWRGMRLPTEEEWEWAARGGERATKYPWGDEPPKDQLCWSGVISRGEPCVVGTTKDDVNPWGIRDLSGNAWEWTASDYAVPSSDTKIGRGGYFENNDPELVSATNRPSVAASARWDGLGFRCVRP